MSKCLIAEFQTNAAAKVALEVLETDDFKLGNVSVVSSASDPAAKHLADLSDGDESGEPAESVAGGRSTSLGMLIGGTAAAPFAAGTLVGPLIIAGPLLGMALGAAIGSLLSMERWGVNHDVSADYQQRVADGSVLVIVHDVDEIRLANAEQLLMTTGPKSLEKYELA